MGFDAVLAGVVQHQLVKLAADDLPGLRTFVRIVLHEVEGLRDPASLIDELHAVFFDKMAVFELIEHVQPFEHPIGLRDQRLADVEPREVLAFEQLHLVTLLCD